MLKTGIVTTASDVGCRPMEIMKLSRHGLDQGWLKKRGSVLQGCIQDLEPRDGMTAIYMVPISAMEVAGSNRNGDYWPETGRKVRATNPREPDNSIINIDEGLMERYKTFKTHALMYRDHNNSDPDESSGEIVEVKYNKPMGRVEAIAFVDNDTWDDDLDQLSRNKNTGVSMSARVPYDVCIVCGNRASRRSDYCVHARHYMNAILSDGTQVGVVNEKPTFFDVSGVKLNADRLGFALDRLCGGEIKAGSVDRERKDLLRKLATMEKKITTDQAQTIGRMVDPRLMGDISDVTISIMKSYSPGLVGRALKKHKILLSPDQWMRVVGDCDGGKAESIAGMIEKRLPEIFQSLLKSPSRRLASVMEPARTSCLPCGLEAAVERLVSDLSLDEQPCKQRADRSIKKFDQPPKVIIAKVSPKQAGDTPDRLAQEYGRYMLSLAEGAQPAVLSKIIASKTVKR